MLSERAQGFLDTLSKGKAQGLFLFLSERPFTRVRRARLVHGVREARVKMAANLNHTEKRALKLGF